MPDGNDIGKKVTRHGGPGKISHDDKRLFYLTDHFRAIHALLAAKRRYHPIVRHSNEEPNRAMSMPAPWASPAKRFGIVVPAIRWGIA